MANGTTTEYFLDGDRILAQEKDGKVMWFYYDSQGQRAGLNYDGYDYYYMYNLQGDVTGIMRRATGEIVATYEYDAWGRCINVQNKNGYTIGDKNPFRYRGYYYDGETGFYYLNSRYYNPEVGRFINADSQINSDILGANLYAYCSNNPVNRIDNQGTFWDAILDIGFAACSAWQVLKDPKNPANWAALAADLACLVVPGATGGGAAVRAASKVDDVIDAGKTINRADNAANVKMRQVAAKGKSGEVTANIVKNTKRIPSATGTASYRIPDGLTNTVLSEVKNYSGKLSYTNQLKDFVAYAKDNKLEMHLYTNAKLSGPLQQLVDSRVIQIFPLE